LDNRTIIFDAAITDVNLRDVHDSLYPAPETGDTFTLRCYVETNVLVGSSSATSPAFTVGTWPTGVTILIYNAGRIQGAGGSGGRTFFGPPYSEVGQAGGTSIYTRRAITIDNTGGKIYGGGGGGGGGGVNSVTGGSDARGGAGGGGAGFVGGPGALGNNGTSSPGTLDAGGLGTLGAVSSGQRGGQGGTGGAPGVAGAAGVAADYGSSAGGAAGRAIDGDSYITLTAAGDIRGPRIN